MFRPTGPTNGPRGPLAQRAQGPFGPKRGPRIRKYQSCAVKTMQDAVVNIPKGAICCKLRPKTISGWIGNTLGNLHAYGQYRNIWDPDHLWCLVTMPVINYQCEWCCRVKSTLRMSWPVLCGFHVQTQRSSDAKPVGLQPTSAAKLHMEHQTAFGWCPLTSAWLQ